MDKIFDTLTEGLVVTDELPNGYFQVAIKGEVVTAKKRKTLAIQPSGVFKIHKSQIVTKKPEKGKIVQIKTYWLE